MNYRVHIHREQIEAAGEIRHFVVKLPPDVHKVVSIHATATPKPGLPAKFHHYEVGRLRLNRDGYLLCELQVRFEGFRPNTFLTPPYVGLNNYTFTFINGGKMDALALEILNPATVIFCKYENDAVVTGYTLAIYFNYEPKLFKV
jgi:hypothetical protein